MRVLQLRSSAGYGGVETGLHYMLPALRTLGVDCGLLVSQRPGNRHPTILREAPPDRSWHVEDRRWLDTEMIRRIAAIVRRFQPDVIHSRDYKSNLIALLMRRRFGVPVVATQHGYTGATRALQLYEWFDREVVLPRCNAVVDLTPGGKYPVIMNGIDVQEVLTRSQAASDSVPAHPPDGLLLAVIGRLSPEKGQGLLIEALAGLGAETPWQLMVIGDGPTMPALREQVARLGLETRVIFAGYQANPLPWLAAADVLAIPSYTERCPNVALEAMALGKVILASAVGALPYMLEDGATGWLVRPGDIEAWRAAVQTAWRTQDEWPQMQAAGRQAVCTTFHIETTARQYIEVYRQACEQAAGRRRFKQGKGALEYTDGGDQVPLSGE